MALHAEQIEFSEAYLEARFSRLDKAPQATVFEFTHDAGYLHQYQRLRDLLFAGEKDGFDERSDVVVARIGRLVVGGFRLSYNYPGTELLLPMEKDGFTLRAAMPDAPIDDVISAEMSDLAVLPEHRSDALVAGLLSEIVARCTQKKVRYLFSMSSLLQARSHRAIAQAQGVEMQLRQLDGKVLSVSNLAPVAKPKLAAASALVGA